MDKNSNVYKTYVKILNRELLCSMGCTEPIALAYCSAKARSVLGELPERILVEASGNIIKNVKSVVVPNTNGGRGIATAAAMGALGGDENAELEVIANVTDEAKAELASYMEKTEIQIQPLKSAHLLDMIVTAYSGDSYAKVRISDEHTNIVLIEKDGEVMLDNQTETMAEDPDMPDYTLLTVEDIYDFACTCDVEDVREALDRQIELNTAISEEGLRNDYGANVGKIVSTLGDGVRTRAIAAAAAGSDARMNGCEMPVVILSICQWLQQVALLAR